MVLAHAVFSWMNYEDTAESLGCPPIDPSLNTIFPIPPLVFQELPLSQPATKPLATTMSLSSYRSLAKNPLSPRIT